MSNYETCSFLYLCRIDTGCLHKHHNLVTRTDGAILTINQSDIIFYECNVRVIVSQVFSRVCYIEVLVDSQIKNLHFHYLVN